ncbi:serine hydrolase [Streptomyces sp. CBMA152]|uniref:serine hydrolase n=1 Tax=Streptomyces sp. CBMA152 TaxID=1896312 RepID=UPI001CB74ADE|nr:serine hydrolase [Streptomyces sp. CBMA152]
MRPSRSRALTVFALAALLAGASGTGAGAAGPSPSGPPPPAPQLTDDQVNKAVDQLDSVVSAIMKRTGVPGVAVGVVHKDRVVYLKGFGDRHVGEKGKIDPDTVFEIASVSKPVASTVVAGAVGAGKDSKLTWDTPVAGQLPGFALKDPWVSSHVTVADLFAHRSGLPDHAGDLLEDLGYDRAYILDHLRYEPLTPFRASYAYTNFGLTAAAEAVARAKGVSWEKLSEDTLYKPAGMNSTSSRFADFEKAKNKAVTHVKNADGTWSARFVRDADAQSPAGGVSSTAKDMSRWLRLQLANGKLDGHQIIDPAGLAPTHLPQVVSQPPAAPTDRTGFYGLGWNVSYDENGRLRLSHSGGFALGAATNVTMLPAEQLGIVVLTNGAPIGVPETVAQDFFDTAQFGKPTRDWLPLIGGALEKQLNQGASSTDYAHPPADVKPARATSAYTGTYDNAYYGRLTVTESATGLVAELGPRHMRFPLTHYSGDVFSFKTTGENAVGLTGVTFKDNTVTVEYLDHTGLGTFTRSGG